MVVVVPRVALGFFALLLGRHDSSSPLLVAAGSLPPVVFVPGFGGSTLSLIVDSEEALPASCANTYVPIGMPFPALPDCYLENLNPTCGYDLLTTPSFRPLPGVSVSTSGFGEGFSGLSPSYWPFADALGTWGYVLGRDLLGAPYDYRYMSPASLSKTTGFVSAMKSAVEKAFANNKEKKVVLVSHSNGGPQVYNFLLSVEDRWKEKYIAASVSLSGNFLGQMNNVKVYLYNSGNAAKQEMQASWEGLYSTGPYGENEPLSTLPIVISPGQNFTSSLSSMTSLFTTLGRPSWASRLATAYPSMNRLAPPSGVDLFCFYGSGIPTEYAFEYSAEPTLDTPFDAVRRTNGDGNQDAFDNELCEEWGKKMGGGHEFAGQAFRGVTHMGMITDDKVMEALKAVLLKYGGNSTLSGSDEEGAEDARSKRKEEEAMKAAKEAAEIQEQERQRIEVARRDASGRHDEATRMKVIQDEDAEEREASKIVLPCADCDNDVAASAEKLSAADGATPSKEETANVAKTVPVVARGPRDAEFEARDEAREQEALSALQSKIAAEKVAKQEEDERNRLPASSSVEVEVAQLSDNVRAAKEDFERVSSAEAARRAEEDVAQAATREAERQRADAESERETKRRLAETEAEEAKVEAGRIAEEARVAQLETKRLEAELEELEVAAREAKLEFDRLQAERDEAARIEEKRREEEAVQSASAAPPDLDIGEESSPQYVSKRRSKRRK